MALTTADGMTASPQPDLNLEQGTPFSMRLPPLVIADGGKVRLGGQGPCFRPASISDSGKVRIGGQGPLFR